MPDGGVVHYTYWPTGELRRTWGARTYPVEYAYDTQGRRTTMTTWKDFTADTGRAVTTWNYAPVTGFLTAKLYDDGKGPSYTYSLAGRLLTRTWSRLVVPPLGGPDSPLVTTYAYNPAGDQASIDYSDATPDATFSYDRLGRRVGVVDAAGTQTLTYTPDSQLDEVAYAAGSLDGVSLDNTYDALGRRSGLECGVGLLPCASASYSYDGASRLATVTSSTSTHTYAYLPNSDLVDTLTSRTGAQDIMVTQKTYDNLNRLVSIASGPGAPASPRAASFTYVYNAANQRLRSTLADGSYWLYEYDALGQVTSGSRHWSDGTAVAGQQFGYTFDDIGNRKLVVPPSGGPASYTSNALNQYESRQVPGVVDVRGEAQPGATVTVNNRPTARHGEQFYGALPVDNAAAPVWQDLSIVGVRNDAGPNGEDAVTTQTGHAFVPQTPEPFSYDDDGNLLTDGRWSYTWDAENRLVAMETRGDLAVPVPQARLEFAYDSQARRVEKKVYSGAPGNWALQADIKFLYDGWNLLAEIDATGALLRSYVWGLDLSGSLQGAGGIGGLLSVNGGGAATFPAFDGNGNLVVLVNSGTGATSATYEYDPFGNTLRATGEAAATNPFQFSTKYLDSETKLLYYGYRYLSTEIGRWINRDPLEEDGGANLYGAMNNDALGRFDVLGLWHATPESSGLPRRVFVRDSQADDLASLARLRGLDERDARKWADVIEGTTEKPCAVSVPNVLVVAVGEISESLLGSLVEKLLAKRASQVVDHGIKKGYDVRYLYYNAKPFSKQDIVSLKADMHGFVLLGHGTAPGGGDYVINMAAQPQDDLHSYDMVHHRYAVVVVKFCSSGYGGWRGLASRNGFYNQTEFYYTLPFIMSWRIWLLEHALTRQAGK
ncbi:MAG: hypothetical protein A3K19_15760 [Lentisphaerae bacterium RIFOXYB12_FULL_65_16]|nr:MAG: hypothetical protein A3K18_28465 [Lentisphaerae bacterium RIFOXYA12_64_32]OGV87384.1 MAG: hypothetical protein A3K19_15760 [Lentisphaerae bacterium RIFOXYB12_FULL_65_16]